MTKFIYIFFIVMLSDHQLHAQAVSPATMANSIGMDSVTCMNFSAGLQNYNNRLGQVFHDSTLSTQARNLLMKQILQDRRVYAQKSLTTEQFNKLSALEGTNSNGNASSYQQRWKESQARWAGRGFKQISIRTVASTDSSAKQ